MNAAPVHIRNLITYRSFSRQLRTWFISHQICHLEYGYLHHLANIWHYPTCSLLNGPVAGPKLLLVFLLLLLFLK